MQIKHKFNDIFVDQSNYTKMIKCFNMNKAYTLSTLIVIESLDPIKDLFCLKEDNE